MPSFSSVTPRVPSPQSPSPQSPAPQAKPLVLQHTVDEGDHDRAFADRRRHPFDAAAANVAYRKHARQAGLQGIRWARQRPARRVEIVRRQIATGLDEALVVERDTALEPLGVWYRTHHHEDMTDVAPAGAAIGMPPLHTTQMAIAVECDHLGAGMQLDDRVFVDAANQVFRHRVGEAVAADQQVDAARGLRQEYRSLSRGIAAANDDHL